MSRYQDLSDRCHDSCCSHHSYLAFLDCLLETIGLEKYQIWYVFVCSSFFWSQGRISLTTQTLYLDHQVGCSLHTYTLCTLQIFTPFQRTIFSFMIEVLTGYSSLCMEMILWIWNWHVRNFAKKSTSKCCWKMFGHIWSRLDKTNWFGSKFFSSFWAKDVYAYGPKTLVKTWLHTHPK